jgi:hypothetical protein
MKIGRRIFFDKSTGSIIIDSGQREGIVKKTNPIDDFPSYDSTKHGYIELLFDERIIEIDHKGTWEVNPSTKELVIYPRVGINKDKTSILSDGVDTATITATIPEDSSISFWVAGKEYIESTVNGSASIPISSTVAGTMEIRVVTGKYGENVIRLEVV